MSAYRADGTHVWTTTLTDYKQFEFELVPPATSRQKVASVYIAATLHHVHHDLITPLAARQPTRGSHMPRILIVEDNTELAFGLKLNLEHDGYEATVADNGHKAVELMQGKVDCVILDLLLPDMPGLEVLRRIRDRRNNIPVLVLSGVAEENVRVAAFRQGADDYITKPFSLLELLERVKARLRTTHVLTSMPRVIVNIERHEVRCSGALVHLAPMEFKVLCALIRGNGAVLSYNELLSKVWKVPPDCDTRTAITHVGILRRKLESAGVAGAIRTVPRRGVAWTLGDCFESAD